MNNKKLDPHADHNIGWRSIGLATGILASPLPLEPPPPIWLEKLQMFGDERAEIVECFARPTPAR